MFDINLCDLQMHFCVNTYIESYHFRIYHYAEMEEVDSPEQWWHVTTGDVSERELLSDAETSVSESDKPVPEALCGNSSSFADRDLKNSDEAAGQVERSPSSQGRPTTLPVAPPTEVLAAGLPTNANSSASGDSFTVRDLKYYHNRLW